MKIPIGSLLVIDSIYIYTAVTPFVFKVVSETEKMVEIVRLDNTGEIVNPDNTRHIRKTSIVAVLNTLEEFAPFNKMNDELKERYEAYSSLMSSVEAQVKKLKNELKLKSSTK